jgi:hypothetical protein
MSKRKASDLLMRNPKKLNSSTDFIYYEPALNSKIRKVSGTKIRKRQIYQFFIEYDDDGKYFPLRCMLHLGSTPFVISPEAAKAFSIPVVKRIKPIHPGYVSGTRLKTKNVFMVPLGVSFGNHWSYNLEHYAFEVIKTLGD